MADESDRMFRLVGLAELQLEELRALRRDTELQRELRARLRERLDSIERTQFS